MKASWKLVRLSFLSLHVSLSALGVFLSQYQCSGVLEEHSYVKYVSRCSVRSTVPPTSFCPIDGVSCLSTTILARICHTTHVTRKFVCSAMASELVATVTPAAIFNASILVVEDAALMNAVHG